MYSHKMIAVKNKLIEECNAGNEKRSGLSVCGYKELGKVKKVEEAAVSVVHSPRVKNGGVRKSEKSCVPIKSVELFDSGGVVAEKMVVRKCRRKVVNVVKTDNEALNAILAEKSMKTSSVFYLNVQTPKVNKGIHSKLKVKKQKDRPAWYVLPKELTRTALPKEITRMALPKEITNLRSAENGSMKKRPSTAVQTTEYRPMPPHSSRRSFDAAREVGLKVKGAMDGSVEKALGEKMKDAWMENKNLKEQGIKDTFIQDQNEQRVSVPSKNKVRPATSKEGVRVRFSCKDNRITARKPSKTDDSSWTDIDFGSWETTT